MNLIRTQWKSFLLILTILVSCLLVVDTYRKKDKLSDSPVLASAYVQDYNVLPNFKRPSSNADPIGSLNNVHNLNAFLPQAGLPAGGFFTMQGEGTWHVVPGTSKQVGKGTKQVFKYAVEVEDGVDTVPYGGDAAFSTMVDATLANPKSWIHNAEIAFRRVDPNVEEPDFYISLTSAKTLRTPCEYSIRLETSCYSPSDKRVLINDARWVRGALAFAGDIGTYRQYAINHEVGHAIGFVKHDPCEVQGGLAPIMMQQTLGLSNDDINKIDPEDVKKNGLVCVPNAWPFPEV